MNHNKPMASKGFLSYRYKGIYGFVMIGAVNDTDALKEASRSISEQPVIEKLEKWCDVNNEYRPAIDHNDAAALK